MIGNGVVVDLEVLFEELDALDGARRRRLAAAGLGERAPHRAVPPDRRQGHRALPRQAPDRHHRPRHRARLRGQDQPRRHAGPGPVRRAHPHAEGRGRPGPEEPPAGQGLQPPRDHGRGDRRGPARRTPSGCARWSPTPRCVLNQALDARRDRAVRGRSGDHARRRPRHLPVRHVVVRDGRRRVHRLRRRARRGSTASSASPRRTSTRVGEGPFPTELFDDGRASGCARPAASTAPPPAARAAAAGTTRWSRATRRRVNGLTDLVLTKLDVLTGLEKVPVCVAYEVDGVAARRDAVRPDPVPPRARRSTRSSTAGGRTSRACRTFEDLPVNAQRYVLALEEMSGTRISAIGVGPGREATISPARPAGLTQPAPVGATGTVQHRGPASSGGQHQRRIRTVRPRRPRASPAPVPSARRRRPRGMAPSGIRP